MRSLWGREFRPELGGSVHILERNRRQQAARVQRRQLYPSCFHRDAHFKRRMKPAGAMLDSSYLNISFVQILPITGTHPYLLMEKLIQVHYALSVTQQFHSKAHTQQTEVISTKKKKKKAKMFLAALFVTAPDGNWPNIHSQWMNKWWSICMME